MPGSRTPRRRLGLFWCAAMLGATTTVGLMHATTAHADTGRDTVHDAVPRLRDHARPLDPHQAPAPAPRRHLGASPRDTTPAGADPSCIPTSPPSGAPGQTATQWWRWWRQYGERAPRPATTDPSTADPTGSDPAAACVVPGVGLDAARGWPGRPAPTDRWRTHRGRHPSGVPSTRPTSTGTARPTPGEPSTTPPGSNGPDPTSAPPSDGPDPTSAPPSTGTPSPTGSGSCANPSQTIPMSTSDPQRGVSTGGFYVSNDTWNTANFSYAQTLYLCDYRNWYTVTKAPAGSTAVKAYPNVHKDFDSRPRISDFSTITSSFAERAPGVGIYNFAYDIWLNGIADGNSTELMIWNDNRKQAPSGSQQGSFQSNGRTYTVWRTGSYIAFVDTANTTSGTVDLLAFFRYVISKGWIPSTSTIGQIDYGVEIVHTDNQAATFAVTDFSLTAR